MHVLSIQIMWNPIVVRKWKYAKKGRWPDAALWRNISHAFEKKMRVFFSPTCNRELSTEFFFLYWLGDATFFPHPKQSTSKLWLAIWSILAYMFLFSWIFVNGPAVKITTQWRLGSTNKQQLLDKFIEKKNEKILMYIDTTMVFSLIYNR